jgi:hypothetical protein
MSVKTIQFLIIDPGKDTDPDPTFQSYGSGYDFSKVPDPVSDLTLNTHFFSRTTGTDLILKVF